MRVLIARFVPSTEDLPSSIAKKSLSDKERALFQEHYRMMNEYKE